MRPAKEAKHPAPETTSVAALLTLALVACRESIQAQVDLAKSLIPAQPHTPRFEVAVQKSLDALDYVTTALAGQLAWSLQVSDTGVISGATIPSELAEAAQRWVARGRKDRIG